MLIIHGVLGKDKTAASWIASVPTPYWIPRPINEPNNKSIPRAETKEPRFVISLSSVGLVRKFDL